MDDLNKTPPENLPQLKLGDSKASVEPRPSPARWLNRTVLGIGLASLFSDWSHEIATTVMPAFLAMMGVSAFWGIDRGGG